MSSFYEQLWGCIKEILKNILIVCKIYKTIKVNGDFDVWQSEVQNNGFEPSFLHNLITFKDKKIVSQ